jgi:hypothetical protein
MYKSNGRQANRIYREKISGQPTSCLLRTGYSTGLGLIQIGWKIVPGCVAALARGERVESAWVSTLHVLMAVPPQIGPGAERARVRRCVTTGRCRNFDIAS